MLLLLCWSSVVCMCVNSTMRFEVAAAAGSEQQQILVCVFDGRSVKSAGICVCICAWRYQGVYKSSVHTVRCMQ
jgi:hypothetical protein